MAKKKRSSKTRSASKKKVARAGKAPRARKRASKAPARSARTRATRGATTSAATDLLDDPIPVGIPCHPSVEFVLDDILRRQRQGWKFVKYTIGPEPNTVHLFFE
jgi:hypothetical protein